MKRSDGNKYGKVEETSNRGVVKVGNRNALEPDIPQRYGEG